MAKKKKQSSKPSSLKFVVTDKVKKKFKATWTTHDYKEQDCEYQIKGILRSSAVVGGPAQSRVVTTGWKNVKESNTKGEKNLDLSNSAFEFRQGMLYATKIYFRVRGLSKDTDKIDYSWSDYSQDSLDIVAPEIKSIQQGLLSLTKVRVTWADKDVTGCDLRNNYWYRKFYIVDYKSDKAPDYSSYTSSSYVGTTTNKYLDVDVNTFPNQDHHRTAFFQFYAQGPGGRGEIHYAHKVFGAPNPPRDFTFKATKTKTNSINLSYDIDFVTHKYYSVCNKIIYQYYIGTPAIEKISDETKDEVRFSIKVPEGISFSNVREDTKLKYNEEVTASILDDQILFGRAQLYNDSAPRATDTKWSDAGKDNDAKYGTLSEPSYNSITFNPETETVSVSIQTQSNVPESYTAVLVQSKDGKKSSYIGILQHSETSGTFKVPAEYLDSRTFGLQTLIANYKPRYHHYAEPTEFTITNVLMASKRIWSHGTVPTPPVLNIKETSTTLNPGRVEISWGSWRATMGRLIVEYTDSDSDDVWADKNAVSTIEINATDSPNDKTVISGLYYTDDEHSGKYSFRARYVKADDDIYGLYSDTILLALTATAPPKPELHVDPSIMTVNSDFSLYWAYTAMDKSTQRAANVYEMFTNGGTITYSTEPIGSVGTEQRMILNPSNENLNWEPGSSHQLVLKTYSSYGEWSEYSDPVTVQVARAVELSVTLGTGFSYADSYYLTMDETVDSEKTYYVKNQDETYSEVVDPSGNPREQEWYEKETRLQLTQIPFTIDVDDAAGGSVVMSIIETTTFPYDNPDGTKSIIFKDSVNYASPITINENTGSGSITVTLDDFTSGLINKYTYHLSIVNQDVYGQIAPYETDFVVNWDHPSTIPSATIEFDEDADAVYITTNPHPDPDLEDVTDSGVDEGDYCDIYRYSPDGWVLLYTGAEWNETYVDPYPTLGKFGGYRLVFINKYGDDNTADGDAAWMTYEYDDESFGSFETIIDFDNDSVHLPYNLSFSRSWNKDFVETKYLGGAIQGDWNPAISHTISANTTTVLEEDSESFLAMRRLARYPGVCRVRTPDGTNIFANVNVKETKDEKWVNRLAKFSLDITRVDPEGYEGIPWEYWINE